jgi:hypothetical protein
MNTRISRRIFTQETVLVAKASMVQPEQSQAKIDANFKKEERAVAKKNAAAALGTKPKAAPKAPAKKASVKVKTPRALKRTHQ